MVLLVDAPLIHIHEYGQCKLFYLDFLFTAWLLHKLQNTLPILFLMDVSLERHIIIISNSVHIVVYIQKVYILVTFLLDVLTYLALMLCSV